MLIAAKPVIAGGNCFTLWQVQLALLAFYDGSRAWLAALALAFLLQFLFAQIIFDKLPKKVTNEQIYQ